VVVLRDERGLLDQIRLERPEFRSGLESVRREHGSILRQLDRLRARSRAVGQDLGQAEKQEAISVRRAPTHERNEDLFVPGVCPEDEGGSG
jgi:hypothetical protein